MRFSSGSDGDISDFDGSAKKVKKVAKRHLKKPEGKPEPKKEESTGLWDPTLYLHNNTVCRIVPEKDGKIQNYSDKEWQNFHKEHMPEFLARVEELEKKFPKLRNAQYVTFDSETHRIYFAKSSDHKTKSFPLKAKDKEKWRDHISSWGEAAGEAHAPEREPEDTTERRLTSKIGGNYGELDSTDVYNCYDMLRNKQSHFNYLQTIYWDTRATLKRDLKAYIKDKKSKELKKEVLLVPIEKDGRKISLFIDFRNQRIRSFSAKEFIDIEIEDEIKAILDKKWSYKHTPVKTLTDNINFIHLAQYMATRRRPSGTKYKKIKLKPSAMKAFRSELAEGLKPAPPPSKWDKLKFWK